MRDNHPILTDIVLAALVRISSVDDVADVLQEAVGPYDSDNIDFDAISDRWERANIEQRRGLVFEMAAL